MGPNNFLVGPVIQEAGRIEGEILGIKTGELVLWQVMGPGQRLYQWRLMPYSILNRQEGGQWGPPP